MIAWSGRGIWVLLALLGWIVVAMGVVLNIRGDAPPDSNSDAELNLIYVIAFLLSAATVFLLARGRRLPPEVHAEAIARRHHTHRDDFMFLPMIYWTYIYIAAAGFFIIKSLLV